jgi:hypothetical protein
VFEIMARTSKAEQLREFYHQGAVEQQPGLGIASFVEDDVEIA